MNKNKNYGAGYLQYMYMWLGTVCRANSKKGYYGRMFAYRFKLPIKELVSTFQSICLLCVMDRVI